jgi:hypothetical protein
MRPASRTCSSPLASSTPIFSKPVEAEQDSRRRGTHDGKIDQMLGIGADRRTDVEHDRFAAQRRPQCRDGGPLDPRQHFEIELRHRHQRAGIASRHDNVGFALLDRVDGEPHRGFPAAIAQRLARFILHAHGNLGVREPRGGFERRPGIDKRRDQRGIAEKQEFACGMALQCQFRPGNDYRRAAVSPHCIKRNANLVWH